MKQESKAEPPRLFRLSHQVLCITGIYFEQRSLVGYVELTVWPLVADLTTIRLSCKQCRRGVYRVSVDRKYEAEYSYFDPMLNICQGNAVKRNIDYFQKCHFNSVKSVDPDEGNGELIINLPSEIMPTVSALQCFQINIEFAVEKPKGGVHFVVPDMPGSMTERGAHMFTYGVENFSRLWFPCVDTFSEACTWKIEVTVDEGMTAVSCGDLVGVESSEGSPDKTYHYFLSSPTAAPNIALAVGPFEILVDPKMHEVTHFCLPKLMPILKHTTSYIHQAFEFYEELMSSRYPYSYYKQVFVDESYCDVSTYSTMSILSTNLLHPSNIIDQTMDSRQMMSTAVAQQFFGSFIAMHSWADAWLTIGITGYLSYLFSKRTFGNNEYRNWVMRDLQDVANYEQQVGFVILDPSRRESNHAFSIRSPHTCSPRYLEIFAKKARLVIRMLEIRIGTELLLQVLNKLLSLAYTASQQPFGLSSWNNMLLSTSSFLKIIYTVTGKDIEPFIDLWVTQGGVARFSGNFVFNKKRNVVELDIKQELNAPGALKYVGTLNVTIQELDGSFNHQFKIEENKTKFEITCHSKSRRNKKKKIPLRTGEEVDMDLNAMDMDSPVLWLRLDPDMEILRTVAFEQPDYMWQYQLKFERCIVAQFEAIEALHNYPTPASRYALTDTIENEQCYYRVRQLACFCLAQIANSMVASWTGPPAMITIFRKLFGSYSCPFIIRQNDFSNFHHYYLLKTMPQAMARLRDSHNLCLTEVTKFLLDLFKYNDNSRNKWSDSYFRAALVEALAASITPAVTNVSLITGQVVTADNLPADTRAMVEEVVRCLNLEKLMPCYKYTVTCSCLYTLRKLQMYGHLPIESDVFRDYAQPGIFRDVRMAAVTCLVDFIKGDISGEHLSWVLDLVEQDRDPYVRYHAVQCLIKNPPFWRSERSALNVEPLVERLWDMMCTKFSHDSRLRCGLADLYFTLYGRQRPTCLPVPDPNLRKVQSQQMLVKEERKDVTIEGFQQVGDDQQKLSQLFSSPASAVPSTGQAEWNPELSSIFTAPVTASDVGDILDPSQMKVMHLDSQEENPDRIVDETMISGEQAVAMEESVTTDGAAVSVHLDSVRESSVGAEEVLPLEVQEAVTAGPDRGSHLSEDSMSPLPQNSPGRDSPPDDFVVSLDNVISKPSIPVDIFAASPPLSSDQGRSPTPPLPFSTTEASASPEPGARDIRSSSSAPSLLLHEHLLQKTSERSKFSDCSIKKEELKVESVDEEDEQKESTSSFLQKSPSSSLSPLATSSTFLPQDMKMESVSLLLKPASSSPQLSSEERPSDSPPTSLEPVEVKPDPVDTPFLSASTGTAGIGAISAGAADVGPAGAVVTEALPHYTSSPSLGLKTLLYTGASSSPVTEGRERDRSAHKAKKKKKKNKHKHKHKHKHDRSDREPSGERSEGRPRERLLLNTSEFSRPSSLDSASVRSQPELMEEGSSSDLD